MAGGVAGDRQLTGIINLDNGVRAPSSADRPSRSDSMPPSASAGSGHSTLRFSGGGASSAATV